MNLADDSVDFSDTDANAGFATERWRHTLRPGSMDGRPLMMVRLTLTEDI